MGDEREPKANPCQPRFHKPNKYGESGDCLGSFRIHLHGPFSGLANPRDPLHAAYEGGGLCFHQWPLPSAPRTLPAVHRLNLQRCTGCRRRQRALQNSSRENPMTRTVATMRLQCCTSPLNPIDDLQHSFALLLLSSLAIEDPRNCIAPPSYSGISTRFEIDLPMESML